MSFLFLLKHFEEVSADGLYCVEFVSSRTDQGCEQLFTINKFEWKIAGEELQNSTLFLPCPVMPFNRQMPTERDVQIIKENRLRLCQAANARDEKTSSKESKMSIGSGKNLGESSEKRAVQIGVSNLDTVENENGIDASISRRNSANLNWDLKLPKHETTPEDFACGLDVNAKFSSPNPTPEVHTTDNFETSQSCDSNKCTSPMRSLHSVLSQHSCAETRMELTMTDERGKNTNISSTETTAEGSSRCDLLTSMWNSSFKESRDKFIVVLGNAVRKRVWNLPRTNSDLVSSNFSSGSTSETKKFTSSGVQHKDARVGILFSGGIDSMMIAALADK